MKSFSERVVLYALIIPPGKVTTYGHLARAAGGGGQAARSVNQILVKAYNNGETRIPFHRIVYAGGKVWINSTFQVSRLKLYKEEGVIIDEKGIIENFYEVLFKFK